MSDGTLFAIGSVVFTLGGAGMVLYGLDRFGRWRAREDDGEEKHLDPKRDRVEPPVAEHAVRPD